MYLGGFGGDLGRGEVEWNVTTVFALTPHFRGPRVLLKVLLTGCGHSQADLFYVLLIQSLREDARSMMTLVSVPRINEMVENP